MHVVATAGHVDHGKSTLVRALTGMEPDRWAEERRRGLTIDLGYAWTSLPSGEQVAFVDVPGHERFIVNMLAGIGPVAAVLFVVAADAGWSRQSEEHLRAIDALGVRHGVLAVTRSDLADPAPASAEARARIARSSLGEVDAVAVSGSTGAGLDELRTSLTTLLGTMPRPDLDADVRLWIDRAFTVRGSGTVVTATLSAGRVAVGDRFELHGAPVTVRGIESLGVPTDCVDAPARVALNLRGVARETVARGDALLTPQRWLATSVLDVRVDADEPVAGELMLHVGTTAVAAHVRPLAAHAARLSLARALPLRAGDRAVLRDPGRQSIVCGLTVLDADPPPLDRRGAARRRGEALAAGRPTAHAEVERRGFVRRAHLRRLGIAPPDDGPALGEWLVTAAHWQQRLAAARTAVAAWAREHPLDPSMPLAALRHAVEVPEDDAVVTALVDASGLVREGGGVHLPGRRTTLAAGVETLALRMRADLFAAPERDELTTLRLGRRELAAAERAGALVRLSDDIVLLPKAIDRAVELLATLPEAFTTSQARQALGTTRRVVIPLLEHLDRLGRTERIDAATRRIAQDG